MSNEKTGDDLLKAIGAYTGDSTASVPKNFSQLAIPSKGESVSARVSPDLKIELDWLTTRTGWTLSKVIGKLLQGSVEIVKSNSTEYPIRPSHLDLRKQIEINAKLREKQIKAEATTNERNAMKMMMEDIKNYREEVEQMRKQIADLQKQAKASE